MSRKIERLINLTIALLATKRYLTKSEIFISVEGYEGSAETKERMFERDKDDLRSLGIEIEVGSFDPLFNDEAGYRIKQDSYQLNLGEITNIELSLLSLAAEAWQEASFGDVAQKALLKLRSIGIPGDELILSGAINKLNDGGRDIALISKAIADRQFMFFDYIDSELVANSRKIVPISLSTRSGFWYIAGVDQDLQEIRTFRLDRFSGDIQVSQGPDDFEVPEGFDPKRIVSGLNPQGFAIIDVRKGKASTLRSLATSIQSLGEWDQLKIPIFNIESLTSLVLWHGLDAIVKEPESLQKNLILHLESLVSNHD
ncbi:MAG: WYL domain-containing protein [Candidatus Planktophila sp.]|nr:WYL domain-containing protein [Candidatus Planktophila sp.]